jgi:phospholipase D1/2
MPTLSLTTAPAASTIRGTKATFDVRLQGFPVGELLDLVFVEKADGNQGSDRTLGLAQGKVAPAAARGTTPNFTFLPNEPTPAPATTGPRVAYRFAAATMPDGSLGEESVYVFEIFGDNIDQKEGDWWELGIQCTSLNLESVMIPVARIRRQIAATYDWHDGNTLRFYNDGSSDQNGTAGAFKDMLDAIAQAEHFIFMADWSFHPMFAPVHGPGMADTIGNKLIAKAASTLVAIHTWDHTNVAAYDWQNDNGNTVFDKMAGGTRPANLLWRASSHDQTNMSHHQKYLLVDCPGPGGRRKLKAFFGGLDLTQGRFDWGGHPILPTDPACAKFRTTQTLDGKNYDDWYNCEFPGERALPRQPWHDIHGMVEGPAAWDLVREFVGRWNVDPAYPDAMGDDSSDNITTVLDMFRSLFDRTKFVQQWEPHSGLWAAQVCRSMFKSHWAESEETNTPARRGTHREFQWRLRGGFERSIQTAYRQAIDQAEKHIYIETQYLIGSGSHWEPSRGTVANNLPERMVDKITARIGAGLPFHVYVVMPMFPEGPPTSIGGVAVRQYEWKTMEYMAKAVYAAAFARGKDWRDYLSFCFLANWNTVAPAARVNAGTRMQRVQANQRYMIYVHSKLMMVDDRYLIFGSANLNERGLAGDRDTEICTAMWPSRGREQDCEVQARAFRQALWTEHFGALPNDWQNAESAACVASVRAKGRSNYINFRQFTRSPTDGHLCIWPFHADASAFYVETVSAAPELDMYLPDGVHNEGSMASRYEWLWHSPGAHMAGGLAE